MSLLCCAASADGAELGSTCGVCLCRGAHQRDSVTFLPSVAPCLQATETGEPRGQDGSGRRGPPRRRARAPRQGTTELGEHLKGAGSVEGAFPNPLARTHYYCSLSLPNSL